MMFEMLSEINVNFLIEIYKIVFSGIETFVEFVRHLAKFFEVIISFRVIIGIISHPNDTFVSPFMGKHVAYELYGFVTVVRMLHEFPSVRLNIEFLVKVGRFPVLSHMNDD